MKLGGWRDVPGQDALQRPRDSVVERCQGVLGDVGAGRTQQVGDFAYPGARPQKRELGGCVLEVGQTRVYVRHLLAGLPELVRGSARRVVPRISVHAENVGQVGHVVGWRHT